MRKRWQANTSQRGLLPGQVVAALHALGAGEAADAEVRKGELQVTSASGLCCMIDRCSSCCHDLFHSLVSALNKSHQHAPALWSPAALVRRR
jgi:hypothetical protein